jgi:hypothetical protein
VKFSRAVSSVPFSPMETCECVASLANHCGQIVLLIAGAVLEERPTEALPKPQLVVITPFFERWYSSCICAASEFTGSGSRETHPAYRRFHDYVYAIRITPLSKPKMTRLSQRSTFSLTSYLLQHFRERISSRIVCIHERFILIL